MLKAYGCSCRHAVSVRDGTSRLNGFRFDSIRYRPISNLPYISKLVERAIERRFISHASEFNLFPPKQSAYRQLHSTETAVMSVQSDIVRAIDNTELSLLQPGSIGSS